MRNRSQHEPYALISQLHERCGVFVPYNTNNLDQQCWSGQGEFDAEILGGFLILSLGWLPA